MAESSNSKTSWADDVEQEEEAAANMSKQQQQTPQPIAEDQSQQKHDNLVENEHDVNVTLADLQADPNSPLYSIKEFTDLGLKEELLKGLALMRFSRPSKIQERALPLILNNDTNLIGQSQSGTGKTAAFVLSMLTKIDITKNVPQALCLAPSRELARQILAVVDNMGSFLGVKTQFAVPLAVERGKIIEAQIVVGTPGTVLDCIKRRVLPVKDLKMLCLDEADNMLDQQGLGDQCFRVKSFLPKTNVQVLLFSATFPQKVIEYAEKFAPGANKLTLKQEELTVEGIKQFYMDCANDDEKYDAILKLYELMTIGQSVIFVRKRENANELHRRMTEDGHAVSSLHGAFDGNQRDKIIDDFRFGRSKVLITTNVIARGIDIASVSLVVNYDLPTLPDGRTPDFETYLHRIGRTGRFGRVGASFSFVQDQLSWQQMDAIQRHFNCQMTRIDIKSDAARKQIKAIMKSSKPSEQFMGVGSGN
ncbi:RNA helicase required for poly(A+) mRNA export [Orbilia oligospora]|uniref:RNA helicase n=1 Tax=Orbilia oligospora TaxID=2813651 RepID=A0A7C8P0G7_ORBOL|nr:RNA helicase required for poly(A+) mRNA export [Orbilia oligospora]KAF3094457.1 RNA helicase required for poly(A+) mRNA export [Orbilia oligospora]KAF3107232.1 RNA helicase required for poly(A+) mRNA export [Orbilia oligospora]KAF3120951.1 RNA helicase required for poly(A+) mRNA export [Orbilia oligospora]KAF3139978.1 RNA helicase required for poly(A+) mRNA export [Orbilia oligospora]